MRAPLGRGRGERPQVGFVCSLGEPPEEGAFRCKPLLEVLDPLSPLPPDLWHLVAWGARQFGVPPGNLLDLLLPRWLLEGGELPPRETSPLTGTGPLRLRCHLHPSDRERWGAHRRLLREDPRPSLVLFPERIQAEVFHRSLVEEGLDADLWPSRPRDQRLLWHRARAGEVRLVVGCQAAATLPLAGLERILLDDEGSDAWRPQRHPRLSLRALGGERCRVLGGELVLGSRVPSSKVFLRQPDHPGGRIAPGKRLVFVDLHRVRPREGSPSSPVSLPLRRATERVLQRGGVALWVLDRKGFARALLCEDCGHHWTCPGCGAPLVWHLREDRLRCPLCKGFQEVPNRCPRCGGGWIEARRPGLEALQEEARRLFSPERVLLEDRTGPATLRETRDRATLLRAGGVLLLGTRGVLEACDQVPVGLVGWVDADGESLREDHDARYRAFRLLWESCWRGSEAESRLVVVQSRMAGRGWQGALARGWTSLWRQELEERRLLSLPPFGVLVEVQAPEEERRRIARILEEEGVPWMEREGVDSLWIRETDPRRVPVLLGRFLPPSRPVQEHPRLTLWTD